MLFMKRLLILLVILGLLIVLFSTLGALFLVTSVFLVPLFLWYRWQSPKAPNDVEGEVTIIEGDYEVVDKDEDSISKH